MKHFLLTIVSILAAVGMLSAKTTNTGVNVSNVTFNHNGPYMVVDMNLGLADLNVESNRAVILTPVLVNGADSLVMQSVGVYGRSRYYVYKRNGFITDDEVSFKSSNCPDTYAYQAVVDYQDWMNGSKLELRRRDYGCCRSLQGADDMALANYSEEVVGEFFPPLVFVQPKADADKVRSLEGNAYVDFPVNRTEIYPDYRRNPVELHKIQASIDSVRNDPDVKITEVWLKGYASPEGSYSNNTRLAIGRVNAIKDYITQLYKFDNNIITTEYEPEDWDGLRRYVENSEIDNREGILEIINNTKLEPDARDARIRTTYPTQYSFLLTHCYPGLRHTDYRIAYHVRSYSDPAEIMRVMRSNPQKLSLNELYLVAQTLEPGSDEFTEVFETAVRLYPDDATCNLNAANAAMRRGDLDAASRYLAKAGDAPEAAYARGALAILQGNPTEATQWLKVARDGGVAQAADVLSQIAQGN